MYSYFDCHCDTITTAMRKNENMISNTCQLDFKGLENYKNPVQVFAVWLEPYFYNKPILNTLKAIEFFHKNLDDYSHKISLVKKYDDIIENKKNGRISAILSIEGGESLEDDVDMLDVYYRLGVRLMTLTWNFRNCIGVGSAEYDICDGLSDFGKKSIKRMNELGILVDVSHLNKYGFKDVLEYCEKPFIASHSNAYNICNCQRNLEDWQIKEIAKYKGVIGINYYPHFVNGNDNCSINDVMKHIEYIINLVGDDFVGIGSDFDGISCTPNELKSVKDTEMLIKAVENKFGKSTAEKFAYGNFNRVFKEILK